MKHVVVVDLKVWPGGRASGVPPPKSASGSYTVSAGVTRLLRRHPKRPLPPERSRRETGEKHTLRGQPGNERFAGLSDWLKISADHCRGRKPVCAKRSTAGSRNRIQGDRRQKQDPRLQSSGTGSRADLGRTKPSSPKLM
ncbi:hypothetical protein NDU88_001503 [Pleurodeles waltl]|uniref:Uncharacterized protein n=1 Tax=Pleurodeles waltl TaxID=8319 RepID=A0AAV7WII6_PLEWA|nr:hypothetical protein NDU88_001503 [Pleurodeles waltl]